VNRIQLKAQDRKKLKRLAQSSKVNGKVNGNGQTNGHVHVKSNGNGRAPVVQKKKASAKDEKVIEQPVTVRVLRTVRKRGPDGKAVTAGVDQENPNQEPGEPGDEVDLETIEVRRFVTEPAQVRFHFDIGRNAHFQSANVGIAVTIPCYVEEIDDACAEAKEIVLRRMRPETKALDDVIDYLVKQRVKKDRELNDKGIA